MHDRPRKQAEIELLVAARDALRSLLSEVESIGDFDDGTAAIRKELEVVELNIWLRLS